MNVQIGTDDFKLFYFCLKFQSEKPNICRKLDVSWGKYQMLIRIFFALVVGLPLLISPTHRTSQQLDR